MNISKKRQALWFAIIFLLGWAYGENFRINIHIERKGGEITINELPHKIEDVLDVPRIAIVTPDAFEVCNQGGC